MPPGQEYYVMEPDQLDGYINMTLNYEGIYWYLLTRVFMFLWLGLVKSRKTDIKYVAGQ